MCDLADEPLQRVNREDDPALSSVGDDVVDNLRAGERTALEPQLLLEVPV